MTTAIENRQMFIGGEWVAGSDGQLQEIVNPATGQVIAQVPKGTAADVDRAVAAARKAYEEAWFESTPRDRSERLLKLADVIEANGEELARIESENVGKPLAVTLSEEIPPIAACFRFFAGAARAREGRAADEAPPLRRVPTGIRPQPHAQLRVPALEQGDTGLRRGPGSVGPRPGQRHHAGAHER